MHFVKKIIEFLSFDESNNIFSFYCVLKSPLKLSQKLHRCPKPKKNNQIASTPQSEIAFESGGQCSLSLFHAWTFASTWASQKDTKKLLKMAFSRRKWNLASAEAARLSWSHQTTIATGPGYWMLRD